MLFRSVSQSRYLGLSGYSGASTSGYSDSPASQVTVASLVTPDSQAFLVTVASQDIQV